MNRRKFIRSMGAAGASVFIPSSLNLMSMYKSANAAVDYAGANITAPAVMPQVINMYLYGGPSELAGNLTNMSTVYSGGLQNTIDAHSQTSYRAAFGDIITEFDTLGDGSLGLITPNGFWRGAGGLDMQFMKDQGYMSVYRTIMKRLDGTRSHRESILMNLKGSLDIEGGAGVGTRIAATLFTNRAQYEGTTSLADGTPISDVVNDLILPFVSFEGDTRAFAPDIDTQIPLLLRSTTMDEDFDNPFARNNEGNAPELETLVNKVMTAAQQQRFAGVVNSFSLRAFLDSKVQSLTPAATPELFEDGSGNLLPTLTDPLDIAANGGAQLAYPNNNRFRDRIRAAVTLAIENPSSLFITVGGGIGGWDDHNNGTSNYPGRMSDLFATLRSAILHIKYANGFTPGGMTRPTDNIVINVYGDFGRLVNLNGSNGWDHANNQNLYTFGLGAGTASAARPASAMGKVVGSTVRSGATKQNNQFTVPAPGSYEAEPMSIAASVHSYFGVTNPSILTADDVRNPAGVPALDETQAGEAPLF